MPVCVHPAYRNFLPAMTAALTPVLREIASLPGAPARVDQVAVNDLIAGNGAAITGAPPVFRLPVPATPDETSFGQNAASFTSYLQSTLVTAFVIGARGFVCHGPLGGTPAQQALVLALLQKAGTAIQTGGGPGNAHAKAEQVRGGQEVRRAAGCHRHAWRLLTWPRWGRPHHPGPAAVTAAGLQKPGPRAEASRPRGLLGHTGPRLVRLHLASRRVPGALAALALCALVLRAALIWHWSLGVGNGAQQLPVLIEAGAASIIAVTAQSPFGDPERATGRGLP